MARSAPDMKKKLNKTEGADGMPITELTEIAYRVYNNREDREKKEKQSRAKVQTSLLAVALAGALANNGVSVNVRGRG